MKVKEEDNKAVHSARVFRFICGVQPENSLFWDYKKMGSFFQDVLEGKVRNVRKWIEEGENVTQYDGYGNTALHLATEKGFRGVCKVWSFQMSILHNVS